MILSDTEFYVEYAPRLLVIQSLLVLLLAVQASVAGEQPGRFDGGHEAGCIAAKNGTLDVHALDTKSHADNASRRNAFLFECVVEVMVAEPKDTKAMRRELHAKKQQMADQLLSRKFDYA